MSALPQSPEQARERLLEIELPPSIRWVTRRLHDAGFAAVLVGGAVRDALIGQGRDDWDLASDATPQEVQKLFPKTIPTGIQHGTVTVLAGHGDQREAIEVTTFRGEGAYEDGRRPTEVTFLRDLKEDLARRDFTVNAFAWEPERELFTDAFEGLEDLNSGVIRAVGVAQERFNEDGLRVMRAVRFAASLGFRLEESTQAAIAPTLAVFDKVARERVRSELVKLLKASKPSLGLEPMRETGLWERVLAPMDPAKADEAVEAVDRLTRDPILRLARLMWPLRPEVAEIERVLEGLKPSRDERSRVLALCAPTLAEFASANAAGPAEIRRAALRLGQPWLEDAQSLLEFDEVARARVEAALAGCPLAPGHLAIKGRDLIAEQVIKPGPALGELLAELLAWAVEEPARNEASALLEEARRRVGNA